MHARALAAARENGNEDEDMYGRINHTSSAVLGSGVTIGSAPSTGGIAPTLSNGSTYSSPARNANQGGGGDGGETWYEVGRGKVYTPTIDDVGHVLKFECVAVEVNSGMAVAPPSTVLTSRVIPAPSPTPRRLISVSSVDVSSIEIENRTTAAGTFTVLSYNVLADLYAKSDLYAYCPPWALSWAYRRQNLLRELIGYRADILCLQEV
jgi:CCR4-NOT transcription complex subunit 6